MHSPPFDNWSWIWKVPTTPRVSHFLRLAVQERLATKDYLCFRHITTDNFCHICSDMTESTLHVLRRLPEPFYSGIPSPYQIFSLIFFLYHCPFSSASPSLQNLLPFTHGLVFFLLFVWLSAVIGTESYSARIHYLIRWSQVPFLINLFQVRRETKTTIKILLVSVVSGKNVHPIKY